MVIGPLIAALSPEDRIRVLYGVLLLLVVGLVLIFMTVFFRFVARNRRRWLDRQPAKPTDLRDPWYRPTRASAISNDEESGEPEAPDAEEPTR